MDATEIVKIDLEVFNNLSAMLRSSNKEDVSVALETIKNLNPCEELVRLFLKKATYFSRNELLQIIGQNQWSFRELTMSEIYGFIRRSKHPNIENIKLIYESLVLEHFKHLTQEFDFIDSKFKVIW